MITMKDIIREGHPTLRKRAEKITFPMSDEDRETAIQMMEFLENSQDPETAKKYKLRAGVGLAAPQIDLAKRMTAVLVPGFEDDEILFQDVLVNPVILSESMQMVALKEGEGCLSVDREVPGYVPRHNKIKVRWYDLNGEQHTQRFEGYLAIVIQHELDHLNGVLFYDHINQADPLKTPEGTIILD